MNSRKNSSKSAALSNLDNITPPKDLDALVCKLHEVFESDRVNIEYVQALLSSYQSNPADWKQYAHFDKYRWVVD